MRISIDRRAGCIVVEADAKSKTETAIRMMEDLHQHGQLKDVTEIKIRGFVRAAAERVLLIIARRVAFVREYIYDDAAQDYLVYDETEPA